ncbi:MAG: hypothetical protein A2X86_10635 [Bdellovibrionales bacterium GWA2_49_15]|nr:MAG: hypothetical protein A2X86_10635 [Bdellovibrionales bacterium GWA2_49_15]HAZ11431.1 hypothetical protein [Bdellovibrionales bacterium]
MKRTIIFFLAFQLVVMWSMSCARQGGDHGFKVLQGYWGHLTTLEDTTASPMFLGHMEKGQPYKVCMGEYMKKKYPGIEEEIKAAINIWAYYIGREIPVEIVYANLPEATEDDNNQDLMKDYYSRCPRGIHLVFGESPFDDSAVGVTFTSYSYIPTSNSGRRITEFNRALFLRLPATGPHGEVLEDEDEGEQRVVWKSLSQAMGKSISAQEILEIMKKREQSLYTPGEDEFLTFGVIVHEFGHVWGLCDQYALSDNETNCDPKFATLNAQRHIILHDEATMARAGWVSELYLSDDDITGIRQLAGRKIFAHDWPAKESYNQIAVSPIVPVKGIGFAQVSKAHRERNVVNLQMVLNTAAPSRIKIRFYEKNYNSWIEMNDTVYDKPVSFKPLKMAVNLGRPYNIEKVEVTFVALSGEETLGDPVVITRSIE